MKDEEMDDLFRRNADYLADEPPRDFDKDAFWQQLQTELPKKTDRRKKGAAWWWVAASVLLAGMVGGIWWMQSAELGAEKQLSGKAEVKTSPTPWSVSSQTRDDEEKPIGKAEEGLLPEKEEGLSQKTEKPGKRLLTKKANTPSRPSPLSETERIALDMVEKSSAAKPLPLENEPDLPEVVAPAIPEKPDYRVVHINEIRQRKQQEAKARSRMVFRIGFPSGSRLTAPSDNEPLLTIPMQHSPCSTKF